MRKIVLTASLCIFIYLGSRGERPNIIYIMTDQQGATAMSNRGNPFLSTPAMDRLAQKGVSFTNAYCAFPLSGPSRAAMFTGRMPSQCGMVDNGKALPDSLRDITLGSIMESGGYHGAYAGKWHLNTNALPSPHAFGFDRIHAHDDRGLAESVVNFLREYKDDKPFFLVASFDNPHNICQYARRQVLPEADIPEPRDVRDCPPLPVNHLEQPYDPDVLQWEKSQNYRLNPTANWNADDWRRYRNAYYRLVEHVDGEIGKIVDEIDRQGLWDNTVVIFTSDHGDGQGAHRWNQKTALWEEVSNVPLIVCAPGNKNNASKTSEALVINGTDLMPSVLDWAGVTVDRELPGMSIRAAVENPSHDLNREFIVTETEFTETAGTKGWMVRTPRYKYVLYEAGLNREALYDMVNDRSEMRNLAVESAYDDIKERHREILGQWFDANPKGVPYNRRRFLPKTPVQQY